MTWYEVLAVSVGLSLDVFAYALYKGALVSRINANKVAKMAAIFAVWQVGAMLAGRLISEIPFIEAHYLRAEKLYDVLSAVIFFGVGVIMIIKSLRASDITEHREDEFFTKQLCTWAAITSIDSLLSGVSLGFLNTQVNVLILQLVIITVLTIIVGIWIGCRIGCQLRYSAMKLGGAILLLAGLDVLLRYQG